MATAESRHGESARRPGRPRHLQRTALGVRIESLANRRGMGMHQLAEAAEVSGPTLYNICTGRSAEPKLSTLQAIAGALGVPVSRLIAPPRSAAPRAPHTRD